jgi:hypothetical protein
LEVKQAKYFSENRKGKIVQISFCVIKRLEMLITRFFLESSSEQHEVVKVKSTYFGIADIF